jgi:hypothetical protein
MPWFADNFLGNTFTICSLGNGMTILLSSLLLLEPLFSIDADPRSRKNTSNSSLHKSIYTIFVIFVRFRRALGGIRICRLVGTND